MPSAPLRLRCEFTANPLGVHSTKPRLSWWVDDPRPAEIQSAYEILAASSAEALAADEGDLWVSGRIESHQSNHVEYTGKRLHSAQRVWWKVRTFDSDGLTSSWSEPAFFEMGMLEADDWQSHWIASPLRASRSRGVQVAALRREFVLTRPVASARLYVAARGDYRVYVNGKVPVGSEGAPTWSDYHAEVYYQTYDVSGMLLSEPNCLSLLLADGYFAGQQGQLGRGHYGDRPSVLVHLDILLADGQRVCIGSDHQWHWRPSWILAADTHGGEHIDARQIAQGWQLAGLDERQWATVDVLPQPQCKLTGQPFASFHVSQVLRPLTLPRNQRKGGRMVSLYDFGDQVVGRIRLDLHGRESDEITLRYGLHADMTDATVDTYTSSDAGGDSVHEGVFALHAFRYLQVEYTPSVTEILEALALRISAVLGNSLRVRCDHPSLNQMFEVIENSLSAVSWSVPMRGVKAEQCLPDLAYAGSWLPIYARQEQSRAVLGKWVADIRTNIESERVNAFAPPLQRSTTEYPADEVAQFETLARTLWTLYRYHDDTEILRESYQALRVTALSYRHQHEELLRQPLHAQLYGTDGSSSLVATCTLYGALRLSSRIAAVLTHLGDAELLEALAEDVRKAFRRRYLTGDGHLAGDSQSVFVAALYHKMLDEPERAVAEAQLIDNIQARNYHTDIAPIVLHALLPVVTRAGRLDVAYMLLLQTSEPSWLSAINAGDRLIGRQAGQFDIAQVGLWEWLVESLVGLSLHEDYSIDRNGFRVVRVRPMPPLGSLFLAGSPVQFVESSLQTPNGRYEVKWWIREHCFELELLVPPGCSAWVTMPDDIEQAVQSGYHRFTMDFEAGGDGVPTLLEMTGRTT